ncbi:hypothetical protein DD559_17730 [Sphingomonas pokkalii]|uniref:Uncharacterized protein n=1 Tax=Sphingomonas pokkalii TaxID=2175090 RepID=A0A2U0SHV2_9SPHN|nr:hypothetical protein DD559_17730 [Sphingomonas pokkalii]
MESDMLKKVATIFVAMVMPTAGVMAADISACIRSCEMVRSRNRQSCMNFFADQNRYTACLSDADRVYEACTGRCYSSGG